MKLFMIAPYYLYWHYTRGLRQWSANLFNFLSFEFHFFSIKDLLFTLFAPFQRLKERHTGNALDIEGWLSVILVNVIMRLVGFIVRGTILVFGLVCIIATFLLVLLLIVAWIALPLLILFFLVSAFLSYLKHKP